MSGRSLHTWVLSRATEPFCWQSVHTTQVASGIVSVCHMLPRSIPAVGEVSAEPPLKTSSSQISFYGGFGALI